MAQVAANRRAHRIRLRKALRIYRIVTGEMTGVAKVDGDFDHIAKRSAVNLENGGDVVDGLRGLLLDGVAYEFSGGRIYGSRPGHEDEISSPPPLGVRSTRRRTTFVLNRLFGHVFLFSCLNGNIGCGLRGFGHSQHFNSSHRLVTPISAIRTLPGNGDVGND